MQLPVAGSLITALALAATPVLAEQAPEGIERDVRVLASPTFEGRGIDGPGLNAAAGYLAARLIEAGAQPLNSESFFQPVSLRSHTSLKVSASLAIGNGRAVEGDVFSLSGAVTQPVNRQAEVLLVSWGDDTASFPAADPEIAFADRIVIFADLRQDTASAPPDRVLALFQQAVAEKPLLLMTAVAGLRRNLKELSELAETDSAEAGETDDGPAWRYTIEGFDPSLSGAIDREWLIGAIPGLDPQRASILEPGQGQLEVGLDGYRTRSHETYNVVAQVPGTSSELAPVLFSAHFDHLGLQDGTYFPGADDNASGVAVLLELARKIATRPIRRTVHFAFFTGEEHGLLGSQAFAKANRETLGAYAALVNIDAIGRAAADNPANEMTVFELGLKCLPELQGHFQSAFSAAGIDLVAFGDFAMLAPMDATCELLSSGQGGAPSDQLSLAAMGVPSILLHGGLGSDYHQPTDTADKILYPRLNAVADALENTLRRMDQE